MRPIEFKALADSGTTMDASRVFKPVGEAFRLSERRQVNRVGAIIHVRPMIHPAAVVWRVAKRIVAPVYLKMIGVSIGEGPVAEGIEHKPLCDYRDPVVDVVLLVGAPAFHIVPNAIQPRVLGRSMMLGLEEAISATLGHLLRVTQLVAVPRLAVAARAFADILCAMFVADNRAFNHCPLVKASSNRYHMMRSSHGTYYSVGIWRGVNN